MLVPLCRPVKQMRVCLSKTRDGGVGEGCVILAGSEIPSSQPSDWGSSLLLVRCGHVTSSIHGAESVESLLGHTVFHHSGEAFLGTSLWQRNGLIHAWEELKRFGLC